MCKLVHLEEPEVPKIPLLWLTPGLNPSAATDIEQRVKESIEKSTHKFQSHDNCNKYT